MTTPTAAQALEALERLRLICDEARGNELAHAIRQHIESAAAELATLRAECERQAEALEKLKQWSQAYPLNVFPEPDFDRAHEVLTAAGMTLDAISASNMRYVITEVRAIVDAALSQGGEG